MKKSFPKVVLYNAVSLDGRFEQFPVDMGLFYSLISQWKEDATLAGCDTLLNAYPPELVKKEGKEAFEPPKRNPKDTRPLLIIPDSRGRLRNWHLLRKEPYWRDVVALCSKRTPKKYLEYLKKRNIDYLIAGDDYVDFQKALKELKKRYGIKTVRVNSGGILNGVLLRAGLVDEMSLLLHPYLVGGITPKSIYRAPDLSSPNGVIKTKLIACKKLNNGILWLRYKVVKE